MSNETTKRLAPLLRKLRTRFGGEPSQQGASASDHGDALLCALVRALLEWNAGRATAATAYAKLCAAFVDHNELRVCTQDELAAALRDHPAGADRAARLRSCLADVYRREHAMSLAALREAPKREARHYLESLDGVPRAVAARVAHEFLEIHAVPVDDRLRALLEDEGIIEVGSTADHAASDLERAVASSEIREVVALLGAWAEADGHATLDGVKAARGPKAAGRNPAKARGTKDLGTKDLGTKDSGTKDGATKDAGKGAGRSKVKTTKDGAKEGAKGASSPRGRNAKK